MLTALPTAAIQPVAAPTRARTILLLPLSPTAPPPTSMPARSTSSAARSTPATQPAPLSPFVNLTHVYGCSPTGSFSKVHPDQHWFDFLQSNPNIMYFANDGGIYRTLAALNANSVPSACQSTSTPFYPFENLNGTMGSMTQFVWFSQHPSNQFTLLGGTQDNGSPAIDSTNSGTNGLTWRAVQGGDGGYNDINPNNGTDWFAAFTRVQITHCANGTSCTGGQFQTVVSSPNVGGDSAAFLHAVHARSAKFEPVVIGTCRVWRTTTTGANPVALSQKIRWHHREHCMPTKFNQSCQCNCCRRSEHFQRLTSHLRRNSRR